MIAFISGNVADKTQDSVIIDNNGIGHEVLVPEPMKIPLNENVKLFTHLHVREDAFTLFGFTSKQELEIFKKLISVKGVGPKTGIGILAKAPGDALANAVAQEDLAFLKTLPGVGAKTASQILLDLKGIFVSTESSNATQSDTQTLQEALNALTDLGFKRNELASIHNELKLEKDQSLNHLISTGLRLLNNRKRGN